jgi:soluble lytic murein transglycosylase
MLKDLKNKTSLLISISAIAIALLGSLWIAPKLMQWMERQTSGMKTETTLPFDSSQPSPVLSLASLSPKERDSQLKVIASADKPSLDRSRARYLLASDYIKNYQGGPALRQLEGLEKDYPLLAPYILLKRGRAYQLTNEEEKAEETWQKLLADYSNAPVAAEALYYLSKSNPQYGQQAIAQFPQHPRTQQIIRQRLQDNPNQPQLLLLLVQYNPDGEGMNGFRDRLVKQFASQLKAQDWQIIADGYWGQQEYGKAIPAYSKAPSTPQNLYRLGRSLQIKEKTKEAKQTYQKLIKAFPQAEESGIALKRLASISPSKEALAYLNQIIRQFPSQAPEALLDKGELLEAGGNKKAAAQARQALLDKYATSEAAADYRWQVAKAWAAEGDLLQAWQWAQPITTNNPDSNVAPKAAFWIGKWAQKLGRQKDAKSAFEHTLGHYPQSYYAWRSAVQLGWNVGDFINVRQMNPTVIKAPYRPLPPAGSEILKELYQLGEDEAAWDLFQAEIATHKKLTVSEEFTKSLFKLEQGKNLQAINQILNLRDRENPQDSQQWQALRQTPEYWYTLFPFPFESLILNWSQQRQLNPLLVTSLIRQESRFEPEIRSPVGAVGLMQVMPATGKWVADKINLNKYSLTNPNDNVNLGTWYLDHTHQEYDNNSLLAVASYNAGPGNVAKWLEKYSLSDPDLFVEQIPFRETKGYVESVFGNYWNYLRLYNPDVAQLLSRYTGN